MVERVVPHFSAFLETAPDAMVCVDPAGHIALLNTQAERLFGYERHELVGQLIEVLVPEQSRRAHPTHRARYGADPVPRPMGAEMELAARRRDGTEFPAEISLSSINTPDGTLVTAAIRDVTERMEARAERERLRAQAERAQLEQQLQQSQRLESLGQLAGGVAHDFNNLLAVILNYAAFVGEEVGRAADEHGGERWRAIGQDVDQITRAAERAAALTHQLLLFGRREVVHPQPLQLNSVVQDMETLLRRTLSERIQLRTQLDPTLPSVLVDRGQIEQVLVNLAVNARDAMPAGGTLRIRTGALELTKERPGTWPLEPGRYVSLSVGDEGTGMAREVLERAFEPFFSTKPRGEGTGLGLATVYGIVTGAGGHVRLASEPGLGTTVTAVFPVSDELPGRTPSSPHERPTTGSETVLVVEDEDAMREVTRRMLARHGYDVLVASSGTEAIALVDSHVGAIDLMLTDVVMANMSGPDAAAHIAARRPATRILFMSGYAQPFVGGEPVAPGRLRLIEKPFKEAELLARVREVLDAPT